MKLYLLMAMAILTIAFNCCFGSCSLSYIPNTTTFEEASYEGFDLDPSIKEKYQTASGMFSNSEIISKSIKGHIVLTSLITYETLNNGVLCHIGWYKDGFIATALNGTEKGKQVVIVNGNVVGISYDIQEKKDHFTHKYTWGLVYSYQNKQKVVFY